jgi:pimeloyl-ACP methyl ester carboxylesterase
MAQKKATGVDSVVSRAKAAAREGMQSMNYPPRPAGGPLGPVNAMWVVKAVSAAVALALALGYASLCLLFYQGQWQLILHPKRTTSVPAEIGGTRVETIRFGPNETGKTQRVGWKIPAASGARYPGVTVLYVPPGDGSLADAVPTLAMLHELGVNLFAFDYRGYGQSAAVRPNEARMVEDTESAMAYLKDIRMIPEDEIVPYGAGVGASLAAQLALRHEAIPAVIVDSPGADPLATVLADPRTKLLPVRMLLHDRFLLAEPLAALKRPKLLLSTREDDARLRGAEDPKMMVFALAAPSSRQYGPKRMAWLARFFDQYVAAAKVKELQFGVQGSVQ